MNLDKLKEKLSVLLDSTQPGHSDSQQKLLKVIDNLTEKKEKLKQSMISLGEQDETSEAYADLEHEYHAISKLLKNARKHYHEDSSKPEKPASD